MIAFFVLMGRLLDLLPPRRLYTQLALLEAAIERAYDHRAESPQAAAPDRLGLGGPAPHQTL